MLEVNVENIRKNMWPKWKNSGPRLAYKRSLLFSRFTEKCKQFVDFKEMSWGMLKTLSTLWVLNNFHEWFHINPYKQLILTYSAPLGETANHFLLAALKVVFCYKLQNDSTNRRVGNRSPFCGRCSLGKETDHRTVWNKTVPGLLGVATWILFLLNFWTFCFTAAVLTLNRS